MVPFHCTVEYERATLIKCGLADQGKPGGSGKVQVTGSA